MDAVRAVLEKEKALRSDEDALVLAVHATLELDGLRCIASSEAGAKSSKFEPHAISGPLPVDWNESEDMYCLYYRHAAYPGALFTVKCIVMDDMLIVHAASDTAPEVYCVELRTGDFVQFVPKSVPKACTAPLDCEKIYSDLDALQRAVRVNLTNKLLPCQLSNSKSNSPSPHQAEAERLRNVDPFSLGDPGLGFMPPSPLIVSPAGLAQVYTEVGRADLTPGGFGGVRLGPHGFGTGAGSMGNMLGPRHPAFGDGGFGGIGGLGGMGGMAGMGGIRTDPFGPPGVHPGGPMGGMGGFPGMGRQRPRDFPDNDIFRPPGGDDMFM